MSEGIVRIGVFHYDLGMKREPFVLTEEDRIAIREAAKEIDLQVAEIDRRLTTPQRAQKAFSVTEMILQSGVYQLRQQHPELSEDEAQRQFLQRYYELESRHYGNRAS